jgi:hypothetical protein
MVPRTVRISALPFIVKRFDVIGMLKPPERPFLRYYAPLSPYQAR